MTSGEYQKYYGSPLREPGLTGRSADRGELHNEAVEVVGQVDLATQPALVRDVKRLVKHVFLVV